VQGHGIDTQIDTLHHLATLHVSSKYSLHRAASRWQCAQLGFNLSVHSLIASHVYCQRLALSTFSALLFVAWWTVAVTMSCGHT
jgi:hypothetical protein